MVYFIRWSFFSIGLIFFSMGIVLAINVQYLGVQSWDVLHVALNNKFGLTIGSWSIIVGALLIMITLLVDHRFIRIGTFINIICVGMFVDLFLWLDFLPKATHTWTDILIIMSGIVLMGLAGGMYNAGGVGSGPRDGFMLAISHKWNYSIQRIRMTMETFVLIFGFLLGGPLFIFTFIFTFIQSPLFEFSYIRLGNLIVRLQAKQDAKLVEESKEA